jgi:hypothetical protein
MDRDCINTLLWANVKRATYLGCFPADELPTPKKWPCCLVSNTDMSNEPGTHWVAMFMEAPRRVEFFCPLGRPYHFSPLFHAYINKTLGAEKYYFLKLNIKFDFSIFELVTNSLIIYRIRF